MRIGSLFSGYGGLDIAVAAHYDATVAWHVEFDKAPSKVLAHHWPDVPNHGDVTAVDWTTVEPVDIITGGFPCQDVSHAGLRGGIRQGTRSGLWFEMARAIDALKPWKVVIENVAGLLSASAAGDVEPCPWCLGDEPAGHMRALGAVLADLAEMGFDADWGSVRAADAGAPHGRLRVFILASATDAVSERLQRREPSAGHDRRWRGDASIGALTTDQDRADGDGPGLTLLPSPAVNDKGAGKTVEAWDEWTDAMRARHGNGNGHGKSLEIEAQRLLPTPRAARGASATETTEALLPTPTARDWKDGTPCENVPTNALLGRTVWGDFGPYTAAIARWSAVLGRQAPLPTEPGTNGRPRLSPRFVEFMMGLPDGWVTGAGISRTAALKCLGNGVVPQQALLALSLLDPS